MTCRHAGDIFASCCSVSIDKSSCFTDDPAVFGLHARPHKRHNSQSAGGESDHICDRPSVKTC